MEEKTQFGLILILSVIVVIIHYPQIFQIPSVVTSVVANRCQSGSQPKFVDKIGWGRHFTFINMDADIATIKLQQCFDERCSILIHIDNDAFSTKIKFPLWNDGISVAGLLDSKFVGIFVPEGVPVSKLNVPSQLQTSFQFPDIQCESMVDSSQYVLNLPASLAKVKKFGKSGKCYTNNLNCGVGLYYIPMDRAVKMTNNVAVIDKSEAGASSRSYSISFTVPKSGDVVGLRSLPIAVTRVYDDKGDVTPDKLSVISKIIVDFDEAADAK